MKLDEYDIKGDQEQIDFNDDVRTIINFGKYQKTILTTGVAPSWTGRGGEEAYSFSSTSGSLFVCSTDNSTNWVAVYTFAL